MRRKSPAAGRDSSDGKPGNEQGGQAVEERALAADGVPAHRTRQRAWSQRRRLRRGCGSRSRANHPINRIRPNNALDADQHLADHQAPADAPLHDAATHEGEQAPDPTAAMKSSTVIARRSWIVRRCPGKLLLRRAVGIRNRKSSSVASPVHLRRPRPGQARCAGARPRPGRRLTCGSDPGSWFWRRPGCC